MRYCWWLPGIRGWLERGNSLLHWLLFSQIFLTSNYMFSCAIVLSDFYFASLISRHPKFIICAVEQSLWRIHEAHSMSRLFGWYEGSFAFKLGIFSICAMLTIDWNHYNSTKSEDSEVYILNNIVKEYKYNKTRSQNIFDSYRDHRDAVFNWVRLRRISYCLIQIKPTYVDTWMVRLHWLCGPPT